MAKQTRKQLLKKEDAFISAAAQGAEWAMENKTALIAGSVAVVVVIAAIWGGAEFIRIRNLDASTLFEQALAVRDEGRVVAEGETPSPSADPPTFATEADKEKALADKMQAVVDEAGGAGVGAIARLYLASQHEKRGEAEVAEKEFAALASDLSTTDSVYFLAVERAALLQEQRGDKNAAIETLGRLTAHEDGGGFYTDFAALNQGRLLQKLGEADRARALFERVEKEYPESPVQEEVKRRLDQVGRTPPPQPEAAPTAEAAPAAEAAPTAAAPGAGGAETK